MTTPHGLCLVAAIGSLAITPIASADVVDAAVERPSPHVSDGPRAVGTANIPIECRRYAWVPADAHGSPLEWSQALSLGACIQDTSLSSVTDPAELGALVDELTERLAPSMMVYLGVLDAGPEPVKLRAAYQAAMASMALVTRARRSLVAPADLSTNAEAASRYYALHAQLELHLARAKRMTRLALMVIVRAVADDPTLVTDAVARNMVATARDMLGLMSEEPVRDQLPL